MENVFFFFCCFFAELGVEEAEFERLIVEDLGILWRNSPICSFPRFFGGFLVESRGVLDDRRERLGFSTRVLVADRLLEGELVELFSFCGGSVRMGFGALNLILFFVRFLLLFLVDLFL